MPALRMSSCSALAQPDCMASACPLIREPVWCADGQWLRLYHLEQPAAADSLHAALYDVECVCESFGCARVSAFVSGCSGQLHGRHPGAEAVGWCEGQVKTAGNAQDMR